MEGLVLGIGNWLGPGYTGKRQEEEFQEEREDCVMSLRKTNRLYRSKAFAHPFCINPAFTMCKALASCWEGVTEMWVWPLLQRH